MEFDIQMDTDIKSKWKVNYNISPTQVVPVVTDANKRSIELMQWGLLPAWAQDGRNKVMLINVRAETILEKTTFRRLLQQGQRCLIFADGFYEWQPSPQKGGSKIPFYFHLKDNRPFAFAGIWDVGQGREGQNIRTCAIITCIPNTLVSVIHDRMPVILDREAGWEWVSQKPIPQLLPLLKPYPERDMVSFPVSSLVNNPNSNAPECILPADSNTH
jgi:putative SOS response-associated peptidase YedK